MAPGGRGPGLAGRRPPTHRTAAHSARSPHRAVTPLPHRPYGPESERFEHFVPPEPPPLPRIGPPAAVGITLLVLGLTLVIAPGVVGVSNVYGLPLGLLALASGLGWLVLRLWPAPPDDRDEDDDGAQI